MLQHHLKTSHAVPEIVFRSVRNEFWLLGGKAQVRKLIRQCSNKLCKHPNLQGQTQLMANLPTSRINPGTFDAINLDLAGPFKIKQCICNNKCVSCNKKEAKGKKKPAIKKCYVVAFVCQASRAIHLELLLDRTTESFYSL